MKALLGLFERRGLLTAEVVADMREWEHGGGFSLDATIRIGPNDRAALELFAALLRAASICAGATVPIYQRQASALGGTYRG